MHQSNKYFSSIEVQNDSFKEAMNVPAYAGSMEYIESIKDSLPATTYQLAKCQNAMSEYGIAQPFVTATLNNYYYQAGAPGLYKNLLKNDDGLTGADYTNKVRQILFTMEYIWKWGAVDDSFKIPETLPAETVKQGE